MNKIIIKLILLTILYSLAILGMKFFIKDEEKFKRNRSIFIGFYIVNTRGAS